LVEAIGVEVTRRAMASGAVVLWVVDGSEPLAADDRAIAAGLAGKRVLLVLNKSDRPAVVRGEEVEALLDGQWRRLVAVSARRGEGLEEVRAALAELLDANPGALAGAVGNPRHAEALGRARDALGRSRAAAAAGMPGEIVALELRESIAAIGEVTGRSLGDDLLERIFSRFCVGK
jgi:tRNA modification GTPase